MSWDRGFFVIIDSLRIPFAVIVRTMVRKVTVVAQQKQRNILDDLATRVRGILNDLDRLLSPQPPKPARVPVPVPVPVQRPTRHSYR